MKFTLTIQTDSIEELREYVHDFTPARIAPPTEPKPEYVLGSALADSEARIDGLLPGGMTPEPEPASPAPKRGRPAKPNAAGQGSFEAPAPAPAPAPEPKPASAPAKALPELEVLKQAVTSAVRAAQKSEGPRTILDMLPAFKKKSHLDFVMNATEEHREMLFDLVTEAGLEIAPSI